MKATENTVEWLHIGNMKYVSFMKNDVLIFGAGCCLKFIHILTGKQHTMIANRHCVNGCSIKTAEGHRSIHIFAYSETCREPILYVKEYPSLKTIAAFEDGPPEGYTNMAFTESCVLITLGEKPNFVITIWNWMKHQKLGELTSNIRLERQTIRCSWGAPPSIVQLGKASDKIYLWDIFICYKKAVLAKRELNFHKKQFTLAQFSDCVWALDGSVHIVDFHGCIYTMTNDLGLQKEVDVDLEGHIQTSICFYKSGLAVSGPNNEIRHYVKRKLWMCDWTLTLEVGIKSLFCNRSDYLVGVTADERIVKVTRTGVTEIGGNTSKFTDICIIHPTGECVAVGTIKLNGKALVLAGNPDLPYVAIGYSHGMLELVSVYKPEEPCLMGSFHLTRNQIDKVEFSEHGCIIVAGSSVTGEFFIVEGFPGTQMKVVACVEAKCQIVDFMLVVSKHCYRLFLIPATTNLCLAGSKIIRYCILNKDYINVKEYFFENDDFLYHQLVPTTTITRDRIFYGVPSNSRNIHLLEIKRGDNLVRIISEIKTGHQMQKIGLYITKYHAVTWGYDGFVIVRDNNFEENVGMALPHHRYDRGVKKARIDPLGKYIISLGKDNNLICTKLVANEIDEERKNYLTELKDSVKFALLFKSSTLGFKPEGRFENKTWLEIRELKRIEKEEEICRREKEDILREFASINSELTNLITQNLEGPENKKIGLREFNLDTSSYYFKKEQNNLECRRTEIYLKALIDAQDKVTQYLMDNYWNKMKHPARMVFGFFVNTVATNYVLLPDDIKVLQQLAWIEEQRKVEKFLSLKASFLPWFVAPAKKILESVQRPKLPSEDYNSITVRRLLDSIKLELQMSEEKRQAAYGSIAIQCIDISPAHYRQAHVVTFYQCHMQQLVAENELIRLKTKSNERFDELAIEKERYMSYIIEQNARRRHIISEINSISTNKIDLVIVDPEWHQTEHPEELTIVMDYEMTVTPYISPSEQTFIDVMAAEEERIRLSLLDDFKERALTTMMNGTLELMWEDQLKIEISVPQCMVQKNPQEFTIEDLRAVQDYEGRVSEWRSERARYKTLLGHEFTRISVLVRDHIRRFNEKVTDCIEFKMFIDSANNHENLKVNRWRHRERIQVALIDCEETLNSDFDETNKIIKELQDTLSSLSEVLNKGRLEMEAYESREKILDAAFDRDIKDLLPAIKDQAILYYKKRPKVVLRGINTWIIYAELSACIVKHSESLILTADCQHYLKLLDMMDQFNTMPRKVDEYTRRIIRRHRRLRIEFEMRVKAFQMQIASGENTIATYHRRLSMSKEKCIRLQTELEQVRTEYQYLIHNIQIQLVARMGLVEIPLTGSITDFRDALLIPKKEIEDVNELIKKAAREKVEAIMQNMAASRELAFREWDHQRIKMLFHDFQEHLADIENTKVTREMRDYLGNKALGRQTHFDCADSELERLSIDFEGRIKIKKEKLARTRKDIQFYKDNSNELDKAIQAVNVDVCDLMFQKDIKLKDEESEMLRLRMDAIHKRSNLLKQIQSNQDEILILQTELELLRLKIYPTLQYKLIDN